MKPKIKKKAEEVFQRGDIENSVFWSNLGNQVDIKGLIVLDVGSGWGRLCVDMASNGARKVVGIDIKQERINFAKHYVEENYPHLVDIISFECLNLSEYNDDDFFDVIVAKDSFPHIADLNNMLNEMKKRLKIGGKIYIGYGVLYPSPYGDLSARKNLLKTWGILGRILALVPWAHLFLESRMVIMNNRYRESKINSMKDLGFNKLAWSDYMRIFKESGLNIIYLRKNISNSMGSKVLSILAKIPFWEDYCIHNVYCILEKPKE